MAVSAGCPLIAVLPPIAKHSAAGVLALLRRHSGMAPSLKLLNYATFELIEVSDICQPRWAFAAFDDEALPNGNGDVGLWVGPPASILVAPEA